MTARVQVIVNPTARQDQPTLQVLDRAFRPAEIDWEVAITRGAGDARRLAEQAVVGGVDAIAVYGGDGTVGEAISGMIGSEIPLAILPGGTANVLAAELGVPAELAAAAALLAPGRGTPRAIDVGWVGERHFLTRIGIGFEAEMVEGADRETKDRVGTLAYALSALGALSDPKLSRYRLTVDGEELESEGMACTIANIGSFGRSGLSLAPTIDPSDGLLDVIVVRKTDLPSLLTVAAIIVTGSEAAEPLQHWQGREIRVVADPTRAVSIDGEAADRATVTATVLPGAVRVLVPTPADQTER